MRICKLINTGTGCDYYIAQAFVDSNLQIKTFKHSQCYLDADHRKILADPKLDVINIPL